MILLRLILCLMILACSFGQVAYATTAFFAEQPDLPLPAGMTEDVENSTVFEGGDIRIMDLVATGPIKPDVIVEFYAQTLPALGWNLASPNLFMRDHERLTLQVTTSKTSTGSTLKIRIEPKTP
jgi:hypothetical protein